MFHPDHKNVYSEYFYLKERHFKQPNKSYYNFSLVLFKLLRQC